MLLILGYLCGTFSQLALGRRNFTRMQTLNICLNSLAGLYAWRLTSNSAITYVMFQYSSSSQSTDVTRQWYISLFDKPMHTTTTVWDLENRRVLGQKKMHFQMHPQSCDHGMNEHQAQLKSICALQMLFLWRDYCFHANFSFLIISLIIHSNCAVETPPKTQFHAV